MNGDYMNYWLRITFFIFTFLISHLIQAETVDEAIERAKKDGSADRARQTHCEAMKDEHQFNSNCLNDDELRELSGPIIAPGIYSPEIEAQMIEAVKNNDQSTLATVKLVNQLTMATRTGQMTQDLVDRKLNQYLTDLINSGLSQKLIESQLNAAFQAQKQMIQDHQLNKFRTEIMDQFLHSINTHDQSFSLSAFYIAFFQFPNTGSLILQTRLGQIEIQLK